MKQFYPQYKPSKIISLLILLLIFLTSACAEENLEPNTLKTAKTVLEKEINKLLKETGIPSISIALVVGDKVVWAEAFGFSNLSANTVATTDSAYSTGSTVKPFMSMAILQLVEQGHVELDKPVNDYLHNKIMPFSSAAAPITLRHLLSHQSGLPGSAEFMSIWGRSERKSLEQIIAELKPVRAPEEKFEYCNSGFAIAARVIENLTGQSYRDYVNAHILKPLDLADIDFSEPRPETVTQIAFPYKLVYNKAYPVSQEVSQIYPAGGSTFMTPTQMARFLIAHLNNGVYAGNRLLEEESIKQLHSTSFGHEYYGLGIGVEKTQDNTYLFHNGLQEGYTAAFKMNADKRVGVYVMSNATVEAPLDQLTAFALRLMEGEKDIPSLPSFAQKEYVAIERPENDLGKFIGHYKLDGTEVTLQFVMRGEKFYLINPAKQEFELIAYEENKFYLKREDTQIEFFMKDQKVSHLSFISDGQVLRAIKTD